METVVRVYGSRAAVLAALRGLPEAAVNDGRVAETAGKAALSEIARAFLTKSRGGTDDAGERWAPLARATVAKRLRKKHKTGEKLRPSAGLTPEQRSLWWDFYRRALWRFKDKSTAARIAWSQVKRIGGKPLYDKYGASGAPILVDTGALLASLQGQTADSVFSVTRGAVMIGTKRRGATAHHSGVYGSLPTRRLWPRPKRWPSAWWRKILSGALADVTRLAVERARSA